MEKRMRVEFTPQPGKLLILPDPVEEKTSSGLFIPNATKETPRTGKIITMGRETKDHPHRFKVGDRVIWSQYSGTSVVLRDEGGNDVEFLLMPDIDPFGKIHVNQGEPVVVFV